MSTVNLAQGLVDPATDPTLGRLVAIEAQLNRIQASMDALALAQSEADQTRRELLGDALPIVKGVMDQVSTRLGHWEQRGVLDLGRAGLRVVERVAQAYRVEDVDELGDSVVAILDTVRALTQPEILALAREAGEVLEEAEGAAPTGVVGLVQATRDVNVQKGLGLLVAGLRHVGRASRVLGKKAREVHRDGPLPPPGPAQPVHCPAVAPKPAARPALHRPAAAPAPASHNPRPFEALGDLRFDAQGFLADPESWTEDLGKAIAHDMHLPELSAEAWGLVHAARAEWRQSGQAPNIRRLSAVSKLDVKDIYRLFPHAPGKTVARVAGIPKPVGCI